jgi:ferric-dicitrate binding protein FerR (iron transport regulator)
MERIKYLLLRFLREEATPAEQVELDAWAAQAPANRDLMQELQDPAKVAEALANLDSLHRVEAWEQVATYAATHRSATVLPMDSQHSITRRGKIYRWTAVAAAVAIISGGLWFLERSGHAGTAAEKGVSIVAHDVQPGGNRAILTLSGGKTIVLDSAANGLLAEQGSTSVQKLKNGEISYVPAAAKGAEAVTYNTLTTPRGGQYELTLPDGTEVWLNAQSSITFPTRFEGDEREVNITGEAYFEVAKDPGHGFRVLAPTAAVEDIGTSFNINSYPDEANVVTTVLTGKVRFIQGVNPHPRPDVVMLLMAGEQAEMDRKGNLKGIDNPDITKAVAWKNGLFAFSDADLPTVMRQLSRWYNVNVKYEGEIPKDKYQFNGKIGKMLTLDQVLKILTKTQVHYSIDGNELTIRP